MENRPQISVVIIHYNTKHYLKTCLDSLFSQTYPNIKIFFIDNNSPDASWKEVMSENYPTEKYKNLEVIANDDNSGYSGAANQGVYLAKDADYILITNPDIIFEPDYFAKVLERMEKDKTVAAITGKIKKYDFEAKKQTNFIDTVGLFSFKNRRVIDDGQGLEDDGRFDKEKEVFGISGACPLYRKSALEDTKIGDEYLDNDFFMYKEDVDLSWRFQLFGWKCLYYPEAVAWHGRGTGVLKRFTHMEVAKNRSKLSDFQKFYGFRNQRLMQMKNEMWGTALRHPFAILAKEILILGYLILREPKLFKGYKDIFKKIPAMLKKRKYIMKHKKVTWQQMERWFNQKQSEYYL